MGKCSGRTAASPADGLSTEWRVRRGVPLYEKPEEVHFASPKFIIWVPKNIFNYEIVHLHSNRPVYITPKVGLIYGFCHVAWFCVDVASQFSIK